MVPQGLDTVGRPTGEGGGWERLAATGGTGVYRNARDPMVLRSRPLARDGVEAIADTRVGVDVDVRA
jgi:hypothetical protein